MKDPSPDRFDLFSRWDIDAVTPLAQMSGPNTGGGTLNDYFQGLVGRPLLGAVVWPSSPGYDRGIDKGDYSNLAPRLGFAYRLTDQLVIAGRPGQDLRGQPGYLHRFGRGPSGQCGEHAAGR